MEVILCRYAAFSVDAFVFGILNANPPFHVPRLHNLDLHLRSQSRVPAQIVRDQFPGGEVVIVRWREMVMASWLVAKVSSITIDKQFVRLKLNSLEAKRTLAVKEVASIWNILWKLAISRIVVSWDIVLLDKIMSIKVHLSTLATAACHGKDSYGLVSCEGNPMYLILILDEWVLGTAMASYVSNLHKEGFMP
ncbi:hypothetical protein Tco_0950473 [Tanacetum coccineum]